ncbi:MAG: hypothetical protein AB7L91_00950 [Dehalococcoidia bacterium]
MPRLFGLALCLVFLATACDGDDDPADTAGDAPQVTQSTTAEATVATTQQAGATATASPNGTPGASAGGSAAGGPECLVLWPEVAVQGVIGSTHTYTGSNADGSTCSYGSVGMFFRSGDDDDLSASRSGASATGQVVDFDACDGAWVVQVAGTFAIAEVLDNASGRIYNATIPPVPLGGIEPVEAAKALAALPCS